MERVSSSTSGRIDQAAGPHEDSIEKDEKIRVLAAKQLQVQHTQAPKHQGAASTQPFTVALSTFGPGGRDAPVSFVGALTPAGSSGGSGWIFSSSTRAPRY